MNPGLTFDIRGIGNSLETIGVIDRTSSKPEFFAVLFKVANRLWFDGISALGDLIATEEKH